MIIADRIAEVASALIDPTTQTGPAWRHREQADIDTVIVHRISIDEMAANLGMVAPRTLSIPRIVQLARMSRYLPELGRKLAYPLLVLESGDIEQGLPLAYVSPHARRPWNRRAIAVAVEGDFRFADPTTDQLAALHRLLPRLLVVYCPAPTIHYMDAAGLDHELAHLLGHGEAPDAHDGSKAPGRHDACPGAGLDMDALRMEFYVPIPAAEAQADLLAAGLRWA